MRDKSLILIIIAGVLFMFFIMIVPVGYIGYIYRIKESTKLVRVPCAREDIGPKTKITSDMVTYVEVSKDSIKGAYYENVDDIIGMCTNYDVTISKGSLYYFDLIADCDNVPDKVYVVE